MIPKINSDFNNIEYTNSFEDLDNLQHSLCDIEFYYKNNYYYYDDDDCIYNYMNFIPYLLMKYIIKLKICQVVYILIRMIYYGKFFYAKY